MHGDIDLLQGRMNRARRYRAKQVRTQGSSDSQVKSVVDLLSLLGYGTVYEWTAGEDPHHFGHHWVAFRTIVRGRRVFCSVSYDSDAMWNSANPDAFLSQIAVDLRREIALKMIIHHRPDFEFIDTAMKIYRPGTRFLTAYLLFKAESGREWVLSWLKGLKKRLS